MEKFIRLVYFIVSIYIFRFTNKEVVSKFEQRLKLVKAVFPVSADEQILSNYYCDQNHYSKKYYLEKGGIEKYKNFIYFIIAMEEDDFLEYFDKSYSHYLIVEDKLSSMTFFTKLDLLFALIFVLGVLVSIYLNKNYILNKV
jgi:hypothetical protein